MSNSSQSKTPGYGREHYEEELKRRKELDPCFEESEISINCQNNYGKDQCEREINNAVLCKKFWKSVEKYRRTHKMLPYVPPPEEREEIKRKEMERIRQELNEYKERKNKKLDKETLNK